MASKTNPLVLRLGTVQTQSADWATQTSYGASVCTDESLRFQVEAYLKALECLPGPISIQKTPKMVRIDVLYAKNPLFEDSRPKNRRKNRMRARLPQQNKETFQSVAKNFQYEIQRAKTIWAHTSFQPVQESSKTVFLHLPRKHRVLLSLLLNPSLQTSTENLPLLYGKTKVLSALSLLGNAEQSRLSLGFRSLQTQLHPALGIRKSPTLRKIVTPSSTLSTTHLFGYQSLAKAGYPSLWKEKHFLQGLLDIQKSQDKGSKYTQILENRVQWMTKIHHSADQPFFPSVLKTKLHGKTGTSSVWKGSAVLPQKTAVLVKKVPFLFEAAGKTGKVGKADKTGKAHLLPSLETDRMVQPTNGPSVTSWPLHQTYGGVFSRVLVQALSQTANQPVDLRFHKAKDLLSHPSLLAEGIARAFVQRVSPRAVLTKLNTLYRKHKNGLFAKGKVWQGEDRLLHGKIRGLRVKFSGPLGKQGGGKKRTLVKKLGSTPLNTLDASIGYAQSVAHTKRGSVGIKVYLHYTPALETKSGVFGWTAPVFQPLHSQQWKNLPSQSFLQDHA